MFATRPSFEHQTPIQLFGPGSRLWVAMTLSVEIPWFLFSYQVGAGEEAFVQTTAIAWESVLAAAIRSVEPELRRAVYVMAKSDEAPRHWGMHVVQEIWTAPEPPNDSPDQIVFRLEGEPLLRDPFMCPVTDGGQRVRIYVSR